MAKPLTLIGLTLSVLAGAALRADEGMWTFDNLPVQKMKAKYGFSPDQAWLDHLRLSAVRFPGGSGSFISADGLVLTNHHVGHGWIERVGDAGHDYVKNGFVAQDRAHEIKVPGLELRTLMLTDNVTAALDKAVKGGAALREAQERLVKEAEARTGLACEAVSLYQGGETWIYGYKVHKDVRLVMAPEYAIAAFGKDWDNFSFPRHDLDFSLFRVYQDGKPYTPPQHLRWSAKGVKYGDLTFVVGHPGRTSRLETLAQMEITRDVINPLKIRSLDRTRKVLRAYAGQGPEQARQLSGTLMGLENAYKVYYYETEGLKDKVAMAKVAAAEQELRAKVAQDPALQAQAGGSWERIAEAMASRGRIIKETSLVNGRNSRLLEFALGLLRLQDEAGLPGHTQRLARLKLDDLDLAREQAAFSAGLQEALEELGAAHPFVQAALAGRSPEAAAKALLDGTALKDPARRAALLEGGGKLVKDSQDPLLVLARKAEAILAPYREQDKQAQAVIGEHLARIAKARFAVYGKEAYPDATFTLRLSYGAVETYPANGTLMQPFTTFGGLFDRADAWGPEAEEHSWSLPERWQAKRAALEPSTPYDFISTNDIIGGNSGSPVLDRAGELVGLAFDGNVESMPGRFYFDGRYNRTISVDGRAILAALDKVYEAKALVAEITAK